MDAHRPETAGSHTTKSHRAHDVTQPSRTSGTNAFGGGSAIGAAYQLLAGVNYRVRDPKTRNVKLRCTDFGEFENQTMPWDQLRSHESGVGRGDTYRHLVLESLGAQIADADKELRKLMANDELMQRYAVEPPSKIELSRRPVLRTAVAEPMIAPVEWGRRHGRARLGGTDDDSGVGAPRRERPSDCPYNRGHGGHGSVPSAPPRDVGHRRSLTAGVPCESLARPDCRLAGSVRSRRGGGQPGRVARVVGAGVRLSRHPSVAAALHARTVPEAPAAGASTG